MPRLFHFLHTLLGGFFVSAIFAVSLAIADETPSLDPILEAEGWKEYHLSEKQPTHYRAGEDGSVIAQGDTSVSILYRPIAEADREAETLSWSWRVDQPVPKTDLTRIGEDDRDLCLHLWFPPERGFFGDLSGLVKDIFGVPKIGRTISYVFGGSARRFDEFPNPHMKGDGHMVVLRPTPTAKAVGTWFEETIEIAADFERAFGEPAPMPMYIAISADSDDTQSMAIARIKNIRFGGL